MRLSLRYLDDVRKLLENIYLWMHRDHQLLFLNLFYSYTFLNKFSHLTRFHSFSHVTSTKHFFGERFVAWHQGRTSLLIYGHHTYYR